MYHEAARADQTEILDEARDGMPCLKPLSLHLSHSCTAKRGMRLDKLDEERGPYTCRVVSRQPRQCVSAAAAQLAHACRKPAPMSPCFTNVSQ